MFPRFWSQGWGGVKSPHPRAEKISHVTVVEWQTRQLEVLVLVTGREGSTPFGDTSVANAVGITIAKLALERACGFDSRQRVARPSVVEW